MQRTIEKNENEICEYAIFNVGEIICGLDIKSVREINRNLEVTGVHLAPDYVRGVINLRGQIVTVVDLRQKFGMEPREFGKWTRVIVTRASSGEEDIGLLVDGVDDIVQSLTEKLDQSPPHIDSIVGKYLSGVYKMDKKLIAILDVDRILKPDDSIHDPNDR
ncbi:MAG: chemotaxis protein CheW [Planctomycetota bacterium]